MDETVGTIRIKFEVAPDQLERLQKHLAQRHGIQSPPHFETCTYTYFDTKDFALREEGLSLRLHAADDRLLELIAAPNGAVYRYFDYVVWQGTIEGLPAEPKEISAESLPPLADSITGALRPVFKVRTENRRYLIAHGDSTLEAIVVDGIVNAENRSASFCEIKFAMVSGEPSDLFSYVLGVDEIIPLKLGTRAEACRGYRLLENEPVGWVKRDTVYLERGMSSAEAFRVLVHGCLQHVVANEPAMSAGDAEALHQARIGLRRLRTALSLFSPLCTDTQVRTIKSEIKWLSGLLGPARDLDVFLSEVMLPLREQYREEPGLLSLQRTYSAQRTKLYAKVSQAVHSVRFRSLVLETAAWIEAGLWTMNQSEEAKRARERPIEYFAVDELNRRRKKVKKRGAHLSKLGADERHALRIQVKKLRYSSEFFLSLFPAKKKIKRAFLSSLKNLQDALGSVNDIAVRTGLKADVISEKKGRAEGQKQQHRAFAAGLIIGHQRARLESLVKSAEKSFSDFLDAKPFWHGYEPKPETEKNEEREISSPALADEAA